MENNEIFKGLTISSPAFEYEGNIPSKYTCQGEGVNPPIQVEQIPHGTKTLALIADDPDAPNGTFDHWLVWNIDPEEQIKENSDLGVSGINSKGKSAWHPPCPPSGSHRYYFHVYALDTVLDLPEGSDRAALEKAMEQHILAKGTLMGRYAQQLNMDKSVL